MHSVTAIVVAHDGARWLKETLAAVLRQTRPLDRVVGVDNGSRDGSGRILVEAFGSGSVLTLSRSTGFGEAVHEVLRRLPPAPGQTRAGHEQGQVREWLWLLHDDCAPDANALRALLAAADLDPKAAVLGPKLRDWLDRRVLLEIGVTVSRSGRRDTGLEPREYDQGQHDGAHGVRDVLSVSTAGMLIRRDVWEELSGLDPDLPLFRDDLDLCWRARTAGHRVLNVTDAVAWHAEASARRRRRIATSDEHPRRLDRRNALFVIMANLPLWALLGSVARNVCESLVRTLLFLVAKQPANALDEVVALGSIFRHPLRLYRARKARRKGRKQGYPAVRRLFTPPGAAVRRLADMLQGFLAGAGPVDSSGRHHAGLGAGETAHEEGEELLADAGVLQRVFSNPGVLLCIALTVVTLAAEWPLLVGGPGGGDLLGGGALTPVTGGAADLWRLYVEGIHAAGPDSAAWAPPYVAVLAALSTVAFGKTWLAVAVLLLGCVPLAGLSAYAATKRMIPYTPARVWLAATYALLPVATGAIASGRLGTAIVFVLLPAYAALGTRVVAGSRRAAWGFGLLLAVGTAFVPLVYILVAVLGAFAAVSFGGIRRGMRTSLAIGLGTPVLLLFPWLAELVREPGRILLEVGLRDPALADPRLPAESLLMLSPGGPGVPQFWVTAGLVAVALAALLLRRDQMVVVIGWGVMLFGVLVAIVTSRVVVDGVPVWPGVPMALAATGLLLAAAHPAYRIKEFRAAGGLRRLGALLIAVVAFATPIAAASLWVKTGADGPLRRDVPDPIPALAALGSADGESTLLLRHRDGRIAYAVLRGRAPLIGEADLEPPDEQRRRLTEAVAGLASGRGGAYIQTIASFGVRFVTVQAPIDPALQRALDSEPALVRMSLSQVGGLWRMAQPVTVPARPAGEDGRRRAWLWSQGALLALVLILASPGRTTREEEYGEADAPMEEEPAGGRRRVGRRAKTAGTGEDRATEDRAKANRVGA